MFNDVTSAIVFEHPNGLESALKELRRRCDKAHIFKELRKRRWHVSEGEKRRGKRRKISDT
jgi:ribosomal protein S21